MTGSNSSSYKIPKIINVYDLMDPSLRKSIEKMLYKIYKIKYSHPSNDKTRSLLLTKICDLFSTHDEFVKFRNTLILSADKKLQIKSEELERISKMLETESSNEEYSYYVREYIAEAFYQINWLFQAILIFGIIFKNSLKCLVNACAERILKQRDVETYLHQIKPLIKSKGSLESAFSKELIQLISDQLEHQRDIEFLYYKDILQTISIIDPQFIREEELITKNFFYVLLKSLKPEIGEWSEETIKQINEFSKEYSFKYLKTAFDLEDIKYDLCKIDDITNIFLKSSGNDSKITALEQIKDKLTIDKIQLTKIRDALFWELFEKYRLDKLINKKSEAMSLVFADEGLNYSLFQEPVQLYLFRHEMISKLYLFKYSVIKTIFKKHQIPFNYKEEKLPLEFVLKPLIDGQLLSVTNSQLFKLGFYNDPNTKLEEKYLSSAAQRAQIIFGSVDILNQINDELAKPLFTNISSTMTSNPEEKQKNEEANKFNLIYDAFKENDIKLFDNLVSNLSYSEFQSFLKYRENILNKLYEEHANILELKKYLATETGKSAKLHNLKESTFQEVKNELDQIEGLDLKFGDLIENATTKSSKNIRSLDHEHAKKDIINFREYYKNHPSYQAAQEKFLNGDKTLYNKIMCEYEKTKRHKPYPFPDSTSLNKLSLKELEQLKSRVVNEIGLIANELDKLFQKVNTTEEEDKNNLFKEMMLNYEFNLKKIEDTIEKEKEMTRILSEIKLK